MDQRRLSVATAVGVSAAVATALAACCLSLRIAAIDARSLSSQLLNGGAVLSFALVGAVVAAARPRNVIGWLMLAGGTSWAVGGAMVDLAHHGIVVRPGSVSGASALAVAGSALRSQGWYLITLAVPIFFPDGKVAGPRWRWLRTALVVILIGALVDPVTDSRADLGNFGGWRNPLGEHAVSHLLSPIAFFAHIPFGMVVTVAAVAHLASRWRHGDALLRQQLALFGGAVALTLIAVPIAFGLGAGEWIFGPAALPLPFAIAFAVLARGLYDLRSAANRTVVWLTLSAVIASVYALAIAVAAAVLNVGRDTGWLVWVAAAAIAVSFAPLRDGLQRAANRVTYGRWNEPYDVLAALGQRVEATADVGRLLVDVVAELDGLGLSDVAVLDAEGQVLAGVPERTVGEVHLELSAYGEAVGVLSYRSPTAPLRTRDRRLLDDLAGHLGGVLHAHRLTADLRQARERLVLAREEERRRLRRDLHDGLGPALAGHLLRLDVLAGRVRDLPEATADVERLRRDLRSTVSEIRRVVEGLRPPALDELGLVPALQQVAQRMSGGSSVTVGVSASELPPLSAAVEVAAFRIVSEAVTNVVKHAGARCCRVELRAEHGCLVIAVDDDGTRSADGGLPAGGHGLQTMRERAEELRGTFTVSSDARGTRVIAQLPLPPEPRRPVTAPVAEATP